MFNKLSKRIFSLVPYDFLMFVYKVLLKPRPLRYVTHKLLILFISREVVLPEGKLLLNPADRVVSGAISLGVYEQYETELFRNTVKKGMIVIDIGAHVGYFTIIAGSLVGEHGRVYAFEPSNENRSFLTRSVEANAFRNVTVEPFALARGSGKATLHLAGNNRGQHSLRPLQDSVGEQIVDTISLDDYLRHKRETRIDVVKLDVEGFEYDVILGMQSTLKTNNLKLFVEFSPDWLRAQQHDPVAFLTMIRNCGYRVFVIDEEKKTLVRVEDERLYVGRMAREEISNLYCSK